MSKPAGSLVRWDKLGGSLSIGQVASGMHVARPWIQAFTWNLGTCRPAVKGDSQAETP